MYELNEERVRIRVINHEGKTVPVEFSKVQGSYGPEIHVKCQDKRLEHYWMQYFPLKQIIKELPKGQQNQSISEHIGSSLSCKVGLAIGAIGTLATRSPLPAMLGSLSCTPKVSANAESCTVNSPNCQDPTVRKLEAIQSVLKKDSDNSVEASIQNIFNIILHQPEQLNKQELQQMIFEFADSKGMNLFHHAVLKNKDVISEKIYLMAKRANQPEFILALDSSGRNAFHFAAIGGLTVLSDRLTTIDLNECDKQELVPLHWAIHEEHVATVKAFIDAGAQSEQLMWSPIPTVEIPIIGMSIISGNPEIFDFLVTKNKSPIEQQIGQEIKGIGNILHLAIISKQHTMLKHIFRTFPKEAALLIEKRDPEGRTPLQLAAFRGELEAIRILVQQGANKENGQGMKGGTAVHYAAIGGKIEVLRLFKELGFKPDAVDHEHRTPHTMIQDKPSANFAMCRGYLKNWHGQTTVAQIHPPNFKKFPPENIVLQGGGAKGIAYVGALRQLSREIEFNSVKRFAGTSAGSITASLLAAGHKANELQQAMDRIDISKFLDSKGNFEKDLVEIVKEGSSVIDTFLNIGKRILDEYLQGFEKEIAPIKIGKDLFEKLYKLTGLCKGEQLRQEIEDLIHSKTKIKHCTFEELFELAQKQPELYKELHIFAIQIQENGHSKIVKFSHEDEEWKRLIISDAVRASSSIPGVFVPHTLHFKDKGGSTRYSKEHHGKFVDGGLLRNYPIDAFDQNKYQSQKYTFGSMTHRGTLGFSFSSTRPDNTQEIKTLLQLAQGIALTFYHAETNMRQEEGLGRTISLPTGGIGTIDFDVRTEQKTKVIELAEQEVKNFFEQFSGAPPSSSIELNEEETLDIPNKEELAPWKFERFKAELEKTTPKPIPIPKPIPTPEPTPKPVIIQNIPAEYPQFIGRQKQLNALKEMVNAIPKPHQRIVRHIYGLAGMGKTELVRAFAHKHIEDFSLIWFINCASELKELNDYRKLAGELKVFIKPQDNLEEIREKVHESLQKQVHPKRWLIIYENIKKEIEGLPQGGYILLVSREENVAGDYINDQLYLSEFTKEESVQILSTITNIGESPAMRELAEVLGHFPLALNQAAHYIRQAKGITIEDYLAMIKENPMNTDQFEKKKDMTSFTNMFGILP